MCVVCELCGRCRSRVGSVVERSKKGLNAVAVEHIIPLAEGEGRVMHQRGPLTSPSRVITCVAHGCTDRHRTARDKSMRQTVQRNIYLSCHVFIPSNHVNAHLSNTLQSTFQLILLFLLILRFSSMPCLSPGHSPLPTSNHL